MNQKALHTLIQSLSANEVAHFRAHYLVREAERKKDRIAIFDYLRKNKEFDKKAFSTKFKNLDHTRICKLLIETIAYQLIFYHKGINTTQEIYLLAIKANTFEEIGMYDWSIKILELADKLCVKHSFYFLRFQIISELIRIIGYKPKSSKIISKQNMITILWPL